MPDNPFAGLNEADLHFAKNLIVCSGNLKRLAAIYEVSYPTVKARLNRVIAKLEIIDEEQDDFVRDVRSLAVDKEMAPELVDQIIDMYKTRRDA